MRLPRPAAPAAAAAPPRPRAARRRINKTAMEALLEAYPWLDAADLEFERLVGSGSSGGAAARRPPAPPPLPPPADDPDDGVVGGSDEDEFGGPASPPVEDEADGGDPMEEDEGLAAEELAGLRDEYEWNDHAALYFYSRLLGGRWTLEHAGEAADGACGFARSGPPKTWCGKYGWATSRKFLFSRYGKEGATTLAREWARRAEYFYRLYLASGDVGFKYSQEHVDRYVDSPVFLDYLIGLDVEHPAFDVGTALRKLAPRLG